MSKHLPRRWLIVLGFLLTDEAFFTVINRYNEPDELAAQTPVFSRRRRWRCMNWRIFVDRNHIAASTVDRESTQQPRPRFHATLTFISMLIRRRSSSAPPSPRRWWGRDSGRAHLHPAQQYPARSSRRSWRGGKRHRGRSARETKKNYLTLSQRRKDARTPSKFLSFYTNLSAFACLCVES
ncbi:MAG: hypothetical protein IPK17_15785 [Chloroflexi bacterium]|uniref:hypothetical protein n=1 Tax=Candidatus Flexifilum breve TaxID=3140694 RepID=UPI0031366000|nr:hypothetical protein [Chloroflexota bacterium]